MTAKDHARQYVAAQPPAISGSKGHNTTFRVACTLVGLGLSQAEILELLREYNTRCQPPWTEKELLHKVQDARKAVRLVRGPGRPKAIRLVWKPEWFPARRFVPPIDFPSEVSGKDSPRGGAVARAAGAEVQQSLNLPDPHAEPTQQYSWRH